MEEFDDIFNEEEILGDEGNQVDEKDLLDIDSLFFNNEDNEPKIDKSDIVDSLLASLGIKDSKVTILDDKNNKKVVDFYELSKEEQIDILTSNQSNDIDILDDELKLIQHLRDNKLTLQQYLDSYKGSGTNEVVNVDTYDVDSYSDDELFVLDMKSKYDLSDEELSKELSLAKQDMDIFNKKIGKTREEYKKLEDDYKEYQKEEFNRNKQLEYDGFVDTMVNVATQNEDLFGFDLEDSEKNEVLTYLLDLDENGTSEFYKALNDPKRLYEAAWFLRYGAESFEALKTAYEEEIERIKKDNPNKVVIRQNNNTNSIHDLI